MDNWRDLSALHGLLRSAHEKLAAEERRAAFVNVLKKELGLTTAQAELYTSIVLCQNAEGSADCVMTNGLRVTGSWIRGEQEGNVGGWLSTMKETWKFNDDLTYEHKIERYDSSISTGPFFQSSYSQPKISLEDGIWAPPDAYLMSLHCLQCPPSVSRDPSRLNGSKRKGITTELARSTGKDLVANDQQSCTGLIFFDATHCSC